jgi:hypothetical protein
MRGIIIFFPIFLAFVSVDEMEGSGDGDRPGASVVRTSGELFPTVPSLLSCARPLLADLDPEGFLIGVCVTAAWYCCRALG